LDHLSRQQLEGDFTPQPAVLGQVDLAHASFAQQRQDLVETELPSGQGAGWLRSHAYRSHLPSWSSQEGADLLVGFQHRFHLPA
jgi:hypothetical protein